jgi:flagellar M-ring protein FliF
MDKDLGPLAALKQTWINLSSTQRLVVASLVGLSVVIVVIVSMVGMRPSMATLFSNLQSADAAAISDRLRDQKVPYELSDDGSLIRVPSNQVYDLRLKMVTQGLPAGGTVGFEIFDKTNFGMSEFSQKVDYMRALQGELARTIGQLSQVENARVHLVIPEQQLYSDKQENATASVVLRIQRGATLGDEQVAGVVHLVASSVEGLKPESITVVDTNGNILSEASESGGLSARLTATQVRLKRDYERQLQKDMQSMLDNICGSDKSVVRVSARMIFDHKETTTERVMPLASGSGVLVSEETVEETYDGAGTKTPGAPEIARITPNRQGAASSGYMHNEKTNKYEVTKSTEQTISAPGTVEKLSVAVMLDESVGGAKISAIRDTVKAALGIDEARGDQIVVTSMAFDRSQEKKEQEEMAAAGKSEMIKTIAKNAVAVVLLLAFLFFIRGLFKSIKFQPGQMLAPHSTEPAGGIVDRAYQGSPDSAQSQAAPDEAFVQDLARNKPDEVANVVKAWMSE